MMEEGKLTDTPAVRLFRQQLESEGKDYLCSTALPSPYASVAFIGSLQGAWVRWDMQLASLDYLRWQAASAEAYPCPFIEISEGCDGIFPLTVGLNLQQIDEPAIKKTIIMIRNYKRLAIGRLEFRPQLQRE